MYKSIEANLQAYNHK